MGSSKNSGAGLNDSVCDGSNIFGGVNLGSPIAYY